MGALKFHQHHHQLQISPIFMTPIFSRNLKAITTLCLRSIVSERFSTSSPKLCTSAKIKAISKDSADELKEKWLHSLTCPLSLKETETLILEEDVSLENGEVPSSDSGSKWVIGIDPDVSGALAVLKPDDFGCSAQVYDSPKVEVLVGSRMRRRLDPRAMVELIRSLSIPIGTTAYIEQSNPFPGDGKQGWWCAGFNYALWIGVLVASEVSVVPVPSKRWKHEFKLSGNGSTKDDSRALACTLFPQISSSLRRKKDHGRAEALLIAAYGKGIKLNSDSSSLVAANTDTDTTTA